MVAENLFPPASTTGANLVSAWFQGGWYGWYAVGCFVSEEHHPTGAVIVNDRRGILDGFYDVIYQRARLGDSLIETVDGGRAFAAVPPLLTGDEPASCTT